DVNVKKDEVIGYLDTSIGTVPEIAKREVNTAVLVDDGQTVVIGGVYEFTDSNRVAKVPLLGGVPVLRARFTKTGRSNANADRLIFLTARVRRVEKRAWAGGHGKPPRTGPSWPRPFLRRVHAR